MAPRVFWKGYLKLSLVTCGVTMTPATTESEKVKFRILNEKTLHPVESRYVDAETGREVTDANQVKGYPKTEDEHVILEDDELEAVALESTRTIDIDMFVDEDSIDWIWYDRPHYLAPSDEVGSEAFAVIREAMAATNTVGISRLVMYRREHAIMLKPCGNGMIVWTLRYGEEVRAEDDFFANIGEHKPAAKMLSEMKKLIKARTQDWDPAIVGDPAQARLIEIIEAKKKNRKKPQAKRKTIAPETPEENGKVINIMDALRKSLKNAG